MTVVCCRVVERLGFLLGSPAKAPYWRIKNKKKHLDPRRMRSGLSRLMESIYRSYSIKGQAIETGNQNTDNLINSL